MDKPEPFEFVELLPRVVVVDSSDDERSILEKLRVVLALEHPYGNGWDSMSDILSALDEEWVSRGPLILFHRGVPAMDEYWSRAYLEIVRDAVRGYPDDGELWLRVIFPLSAEGWVRETLAAPRRPCGEG